eukprot:7227340-Pyramimonas_sp.AAC.2
MESTWSVWRVPLRQLVFVLVVLAPVLRVESQLPVPPLPRLHNWAGNVVFEAMNLRTPAGIGELQHAVKRADYVRPVPYHHRSEQRTGYRESY